MAIPVDASGSADGRCAAVRSIGIGRTLFRYVVREVAIPALAALLVFGVVVLFGVLLPEAWYVLL